MYPEVGAALSPVFLERAVVAFVALSVLLLMVVFVRVAGGEWLQMSRRERRAQRAERHLASLSDIGAVDAASAFAGPARSSRSTF